MGVYVLLQCETMRTRYLRRKLFARTRRLFLRFVYPLWAVVATREKVDSLNEESLRAAEKGNGEVTIILHGIMTNYYSAVYWALLWFKRSKINVVSLGYDYRDDLKTCALQIKPQIDAIIARPGIKKINMVGISLGGQVARYYIEKLGGKDVVNRLVTVFSPLIAPNDSDFSIAKVMTELSGNKEITRISLEHTRSIENSFSVEHLALYGTSDLIVGKLAHPLILSSNVMLVPVPGGHTLVSYNTTAMEYALEFIVYGKEAIAPEL